MASEIRVNKIANRAGLSTVQYTDTGIIVSGIVTCTEVSGLNVLNIAGVSTFANTLDINGDIDVDGHTNLDNLSVAGVSTFTGALNVGNNIQFTPSSGAITVGSQEVDWNNNTTEVQTRGFLLRHIEDSYGTSGTGNGFGILAYTADAEF